MTKTVENENYGNNYTGKTNRITKQSECLVTRTKFIVTVNFGNAPGQAAGTRGAESRGYYLFSRRITYCRSNCSKSTHLRVTYARLVIACTLICYQAYCQLDCLKFL